MPSPIKKILIESNSGKKYLVKDLTEDFHTSFGVINKKDLKGEKTNIRSSTGKTFQLLDATFPDLWEQFQRGPQIMLQKDIGLVIAKTGINKDSEIVDAGGGSGSLCLSLANICKKVTVYETHPEHHKVVQKNIALCGLTNVTLKQEDIYKGIKEKELDLITLDLPEPWQVTKHAEKVLKSGGYLVIYLPNLTQMQKFLVSLKGSPFKVLETVELLERKWAINEQIMRPEFQMLGHTGFMAFCRKM
ncbi:MAG TPA: methyltransferase domain-containing protein [Candidatus Nanoarchaeia archaeon]|nr:methyltransferase domain-containing protein [Candidatus Nanoarchaeia archaeon]